MEFRPGKGDGGEGRTLCEAQGLRMKSRFGHYRRSWANLPGAGACSRRSKRPSCAWRAHWPWPSDHGRRGRSRSCARRPGCTRRAGRARGCRLAAGSVLAVPASPEFAGQGRRELGVPVPHRLVAEHEAAVEEHLAEVAQGQAVAQPPQHHQGDDVGRVLRPVQHAGAGLVELPAAVTAAEPAVALGGALRPLRHRRRAAAHAVHPRPPRWSRCLPAVPRPAKQARWHEP